MQSFDILEYVFYKLQLHEENLEIKLPRSLSVEDILSFKFVNENTRFWVIDHIGGKKM